MTFNPSDLDLVLLCATDPNSDKLYINHAAYGDQPKTPGVYVKAVNRYTKEADVMLSQPSVRLLHAQLGAWLAAVSPESHAAIIAATPKAEECCPAQCGGHCAVPKVEEKAEREVRSVATLFSYPIKITPFDSFKLCDAFWDEFEDTLHLSWGVDVPGQPTEAWFYAPNTDAERLGMYKGFVLGFVQNASRKP